jgi:hypothetical protein
MFGFFLVDDTAKVSKSSGSNIGASKAQLPCPREQTIPRALLSRKSEIMKTVADQFAETLGAAGVKRIYGIVGDNQNGLTGVIFRPAQAAFASGW